MKPLRWQAQGSFTSFVLVEDEPKKLVFVVTESSSKWSAIALETEGNNIDAALASHAHQLLGEFDSVSEAFAACETYAAEWRAGKRADPCGCEEIETPAEPVKIDAEFMEDVDQRSQALVDSVCDYARESLPPHRPEPQCTCGTGPGLWHALDCALISGSQP
jgi:hypothetical protein